MDDRLATKWLRALLLAALLSGCTSANTAIRLSVLYDEGWMLNELEVASDGQGMRVVAEHEVLVLVSDEHADREITIEIAGLRDETRAALGRVVVRPLFGTEVQATIVLSPLACASLSPPENATLEGGVGMAGEVATYACGEGYVLTGNGGSNMRTCLAGGSWTGTEPSCGAAIAPCEPSPCLNGGTCTLDGSSFACACAPGYAGTSCETRVRCGELVPPDNGSIDRTSGAAADVATYRCNDGYTLTGNGSSNMRTCQSNGTWTGSDPSCDPVLSACDPNPCLNSGTCEAQGESAFSCTCAPGYAGATCEMRVACPALSAPTNGTIDRTTGGAGDVATYGCNNGYALSGNAGSNLRTCQTDGTWSGSDPSCEALVTPCDPSPCANGGSCSENGADSFVCTCTAGYVGSTCTARVECSTLSAPIHGSVNRTTGFYGDIAIFSCESGYAMTGNSGSSARTCEASGAWSGATPSCEPLSAPCDPNPCVNGGTCTVDGPSFHCTCAAGYTGDTCATAVACGTLSAPTDGWVDRTTGSPGAVATYSCKSGFYLVGPESRTCQSDGSWTGAVPRCESTGGYPVWPLPGSIEYPPSYTTRAATVIDNITRLEWQRAVPSSSYSHSAAVSYCDGLALDGRSDWRLPTRIELMSIVDYTRRPTFNALVFPSTPAGSERFWSFSSLARDSTQAFQVGFEWGDVLLEQKSASRRVRCVRGGLTHSVPPSSRFSVDTAGGFVVDNFTDLVWRRAQLSTQYNASEAGWECQSLGYRLPTVFELASIVDENRNPAIDTSVFGVSGGWYWSSSSPGSGFRDYLVFNDGTANNTSSSLEEQVLCVR